MVKRLVPLLLIAIVSAVIDLITKGLFNYTPPDPKTSLIPGVLEMNPQINTGIIWGLFSDTSVVLLVIIPLLAIPMIITVFLLTQRNEIKNNPSGKLDWLIISALGLILGGAIGNIYDRIFHHGVRDFIHYYYIIDWPTFNIADVYITAGAVLMIISLFRKEKESIITDKPPVESAVDVAEKTS
ncbi:MAG: signal peptidase II [Planctomycetes bacterium]|nr:signal peptidase II [Planctomycetota bacterium]